MHNFATGCQDSNWKTEYANLAATCVSCCYFSRFILREAMKFPCSKPTLHACVLSLQERTSNSPSAANETRVFLEVNAVPGAAHNVRKRVTTC